MGPDGVMSLLRDSQIDHMSVNCLFFAYKCNARQQAIFTREELVKGFTDLGFALLILNSNLIELYFQNVDYIS